MSPLSTPMVELRAVSRSYGSPPALAQRLWAGLRGRSCEASLARAVSEVSLTIGRGEVLGLVGESGCGKSTLGKLVAGILPPTGGTVRVDGAPVMSSARSPRKCTTRVQTVFQDPFASLDPRMRVGDQISAGPVVHGLVSRARAAQEAADWLSRVGLDPALAARYPHQFSGGQRQRIALARALAMRPDVLVCDEPVASLDVSIQAQVLNVLLQLRRDLGLTVLFISHHLGVVRHVSDRVAVMYLGRIVEVASAAALYESPQHPYTRALLASVPKLTMGPGRRQRLEAIRGEAPSALSPPPGCHFHPRCGLADEACRTRAPQLTLVAAGHEAACWRAVSAGAPVIRV